MSVKKKNEHVYNSHNLLMDLVKKASTERRRELTKQSAEVLRAHGWGFSSGRVVYVGVQKSSAGRDLNGIY